MVDAARRPGLPRTLYLETTNRCNLRCKGCIQYHGHWEPQRDLSLEEFTMITGQVPDLERAVLHGIGEPLLNKALPEMIRRLKERKVHVLFNSNGILLDAERQNELLESGLDELRISLDAATPEVYRSVRNSDAFDAIVENLRNFGDTLRRRQTRRPKVSLWFLATRENIFELPGLIELASSLGINEVYLQRLVFFQDHGGYGLARRENSLMGEENACGELIEASQLLAAELGVSCHASGQATPLDSLQGQAKDREPWRQCYRPETLAYITANGNVLPCCIAPFATSDYQAIVMGNVFTEKLVDIWHGRHYTRFRQQRQTGSPPMSCKGCGITWSL